jgi:2Fe-2S ferredoxin
MHLVELMRAHGLPVKAECGGAGACATCHVHVPAAWRHRLPPPSNEELAKLDEIPGADASSRLACQITMTVELDGLVLELQPDSRLASSPQLIGPLAASAGEVA